MSLDHLLCKGCAIVVPCLPIKAPWKASVKCFSKPLCSLPQTLIVKLPFIHHDLCLKVKYIYITVSQWHSEAENVTCTLATFYRLRLCLCKDRCNILNPAWSWNKKKKSSSVISTAKLFCKEEKNMQIHPYANINADSFIVWSVFESLSPGHLPSLLCQLYAINNATIVTNMSHLE